VWEQNVEIVKRIYALTRGTSLGARTSDRARTSGSLQKIGVDPFSSSANSSKLSVT
jgi:hypothetical protein